MMTAEQLITGGYAVYIGSLIIFLTLVGIATILHWIVKFFAWVFKKNAQELKDAQEILDEVKKEQDKKYNLSGKEIEEIQNKVIKEDKS